MKIFFSHSSNEKPLVREIKNGLPKYITTWLDEEQLVFDKDISLTIENTISLQADFVVLFLSEKSAKSDWVKRELMWALKIERTMEDPFLLVINLGVADETLIELNLFDRQYLSLVDFTLEGVNTAIIKLTNSLLALITRRLDRFTEVIRKQNDIKHPLPSVPSIETMIDAKSDDEPEELVRDLLRNGRLRLICAADLERSHRIKRDGSPNYDEPWTVKFEHYYDLMESILEISYQKYIPDCLETDFFRIDEPLRAYRTRNDAIFFSANLTNHRQALYHIIAFKKAVSLFNSLREENMELMVEGTAWISGTPITDAKIRLRNSPNYYDIIGPSIDIGRELMEIAETRYIALSFDLTLMLLKTLQESDIAIAILPLVYDGKKRFSSFFNGEQYPKIYLDSLDGMQSDEQLITNKKVTFANHEHLFAFCDQLKTRYNFPDWFISQDESEDYAGPDAKWIGNYKTVSDFRNTLRKKRSDIIELLRSR